jgi:putative ABC transport system substrate-binding protein
MRRRKFITLLGGVSASWSLAARAQQAMPVIGWLHSGSLEPQTHNIAAFRQGLSEIGYIEGQNVAIDFRWANNQYKTLSTLAHELAYRKVNLVFVGSGDLTALAAKAATSTIPIVFIINGDPVELGLVASIARPNGNATGLSLFGFKLENKRLGLLRELLPDARIIGLIVNPDNPNAQAQSRDMLAAAKSLGEEIRIYEAVKVADFEVIFASLIAHRVDGVIVGSDPVLTSLRDNLVGLAARHAIPAIYQWREFIAAGGLISYGTSLPDSYRQVTAYIGRILKGAKPADLPVIQPTKFELVINLKTAKALGLAVPPTLLARADEVIE